MAHDGVAANNDEMALGALQAIKAAGKIGKIPVGGTDGTHGALESMDKGELNNTVFQDPVTVSAVPTIWPRLFIAAARLSFPPRLSSPLVRARRRSLPL
jgi:hypothetical protein